MSSFALFLAFTGLLPLQVQGSSTDAREVSGSQAPIKTPVHALPGAILGTERWIVHFKKRSFDLGAFRNTVYSGGSAADLAEVVKSLEQDVIADQAAFVGAVARIGGKVQVQWWIINACAVDIPFAKLNALRALANVDFIEADQETLPVIKTATNANNHNADALQAKGIIGKGVASAIMDTGQDSNMGTSGRPHRTYYPLGNASNKTGTGIGKSRLVVNKKLGLMSADDVHGHGTGVASIVAGGKWGSTTADHGHAYGANIAGYAIANNTRGSSTYTVMTSAWQSIAADKLKYKIVSANNSYSGSPSPLNSVQKALDSAALNADILVCTAAGNSGTRTSSSQICVNGLSVAAVNENSKTLASFSSRGTPDGQLFPDIAANGVSTNMARRNSENTDYIGSGTSMASPQVCGAATQIRAANLKLRADETKAILLASTLKNSLAGSTQVSTGPGCGYLKNDAAYVIATSPKRHGRFSMGKRLPAVYFNMIVKKGVNYQVAIAWHRLDVSSTTWSNIDLAVKDGTTTVISSSTLRNSEEFVRFTASKSGVFTVIVTAKTLAAPSQPVAWACTADLAITTTIPGSYDRFGAGCIGSFTVPGPLGYVFPKAFTTKFGPGYHYLGFNPGEYNMRYQQILLGSESPQSMTVTGYSFRQDERISGNPGGTQTYTVLMGYTKYTPANLTAVFASNFNAGKKPTTVFTGKMNIPTWTGTNKDVKNFGFTVKFPRPWVYVKRVGENILFDVTNTGAAKYTSQYADEAYAPGAVTRVYSTTSTATSGRINRDYGLVIRLNMQSGRVRVAPEIGSVGGPDLNKSFKVTLSKAMQNSVGVLVFGVSDTVWGPVKLPFNLGALGAKDCNLLVSYDFTMPTGTSSLGAGGITISVPSSTALRGKIFYNQYFVLDKAANGLGLSFTGGAMGRIGG